MLALRAVGEQVGHRRVGGDRADPLGRDVPVEARPALAQRSQHLVLGDRAEELLHRPGHVDHRGLALAQGAGGHPGAGVDVQHVMRLLHHRRGGQDPGPVDVGDELRHVVVGRVGEDLLGGADLDDPAVPHHRDPVAEPHGLVQVVGDEDDGLAQLALKFQELVLDLPADEWVQRREGLVHQHDVGVGREGAGQPDPLSHAAGELVGELVRPLLQAHHAQGVEGTRAPLGLGQAGDLEGVPGVIQHGPVWHEREVLEDHADLVPPQLAQRGGLERGEFHPVDLHAAPGGAHQAVEHPDEGGLAGAGEAHHDEDLAGAYLEVRVDHGGRGRQARHCLGSRGAAGEAPHRLVGSVAEYLVERLHRECGHGPLSDDNRWRIAPSVAIFVSRPWISVIFSWPQGPGRKPTDVNREKPVRAAGTVDMPTRRRASQGPNPVVRTDCGRACTQVTIRWFDLFWGFCSLRRGCRRRSCPLPPFVPNLMTVIGDCHVFVNVLSSDCQITAALPARRWRGSAIVPGRRPAAHR